MQRVIEICDKIILVFYLGLAHVLLYVLHAHVDVLWQAEASFEDNEEIFIVRLKCTPAVLICWHLAGSLHVMISVSCLVTVDAPGSFAAVSITTRMLIELVPFVYWSILAG